MNFFFHKMGYSSSGGGWWSSHTHTLQIPPKKLRLLPDCIREQEVLRPYDNFIRPHMPIIIIMIRLKKKRQQKNKNALFCKHNCHMRIGGGGGGGGGGGVSVVTFSIHPRSESKCHDYEEK